MTTNFASTWHILSVTGLFLSLVIFWQKKLFFKLKNNDLKHKIIRMKINFERNRTSPDLPRGAKKCLSLKVKKYLELVQSRERVLDRMSFTTDNEYRARMGMCIDISSIDCEKSIFKIDQPIVENVRWFRAYAIKVNRGKVLIFRPFYTESHLPLIYTIGEVEVSEVIATLVLFYTPRVNDTVANIVFEKEKKELTLVCN